MPDSPPYRHLAAGYDAVMDYVDYAHWAAYARGLLRQHAPGTESIVELGCGTGELARHLQPMGPHPGGFIYRAYDGEPAMAEVARRKMKALELSVAVGVLDFREAVPAPLADAVLLLYDGINYLLTEADVSRTLSRMHDAVHPRGIVLFDQSTPVNSERHAGGFDDEGETNAFHYIRRSEYDAEQRLHTTTFELTTEDATHRESHVQRAYTVKEVKALLEASPLEPVAAYHGFTTRDAHASTYRVHWVARRPHR